MTRTSIKVEIQIKGFEEFKRILREVEEIRKSNPKETIEFTFSVTE